MRICNLSDDELQIKAAQQRKIAEYMGGGDRISQIAADTKAAFEELIDRRAAMSYTHPTEAQETIHADL